MARTIKGLDELLKHVKSVEELQKKLAPPMVRSLVLIHKDLAKYPRKAKGAFSSMATKGQKAAFWARVGKGIINFREGVGYVRSGATGRKWTSEVRMMGNKIRGVVGNNELGAFFTADPIGQQPFHKASGFITTDDALKRNEPKIRREFEAVFKKGIEG